MTETTFPTTNPILGIEDDLPEEVIVLGALNGKHAGFCSHGVHCLVGFHSKLQAAGFLFNYGPAVGLAPEKTNYFRLKIDQALDLAKSKPDPCVALGIWGGTDIARMIYVK